MTKTEYAEYEADVAKFFKREGIHNLSTASEEDIETGKCRWCNEEVYIDWYFSWRHCECCGSNLGGDRQHVSGYNPKTEEVSCYEVCIDCYYYAEYGQLDDMTMMDMEE